ncbi:tryptophan 2,3-dioxygenase [Hwanghaeella grinnelliae]|uniref:Tryptophan 2,3-dioxygenase n=1 Tax=Hwanghaeella grinnelliae TaxID=2500179 RepID=A0A437QGQ1_9PROT|nr:tryptophan 2,3-dioxygenase [Hwanghaeella grinnelliae]RVU33741.1 tryptophan 2,3-dioxygenase [Hwanghaeella grinnelliae]
MTDETKRGENLPEGAHTDFSDSMSYGGYLRLTDLLSAQKPVSDAHDEMLFIVIHQATELWMKLIIHEIRAAMAALEGDAFGPAFKMLSRVARIQTQLIQSWSVLSTMTPADYLTFRDDLGRSSGFQSAQYREIEFLMGNKRRAMLAPFAETPAVHAHLLATLEGPSLYDVALEALKRNGFEVSDEVLRRDRTHPYQADDSVRKAWTSIYQKPDGHWELYELAEKLVDLEDSFQQWRFRHLETVKRIIGHRRGTGGTAGVGYLQHALSYVFFPELWDLRTEL